MTSTGFIHNNLKPKIEKFSLKSAAFALNHSIKTLRVILNEDEFALAVDRSSYVKNGFE